MDTSGTCLRIYMLDFSKDFDRIDFNILMQKLINMRVHPFLINWIANFLTDRSQRTRIGSNFSSWRTTNGRVPEWTKLGPLLFLIMVNDLNISDDTVKFVDDTTIWEPSGHTTLFQRWILVEKRLRRRQPYINVALMSFYKRWFNISK